MIESLAIEGLGVIDTAEIEPHAGLTVLTGETGAGKTMVLSGLSLVLGARADGGALRPGVPRAAATAVVHLDPADEVLGRVVDAGGQVDNGTLILVRTVSAEGRSRAHAGGTTVPAALLADIADRLVTVHGQSDQLRLLRADRQRELLDAYADRLPTTDPTDPTDPADPADPTVASPLPAYRSARAAWAADTEELAALLAARESRAREAAVLRHGLEEIAAADPHAGEDDDLAAEQNRLTHAETLAAAVRAAHDALAGDGAATVTDLVAGAVAELGRAAVHDGTLGSAVDRVRELGLLAADVAADLASYLAGTEPDPARLATIGERRDLLTRLVRRWAPGGAEAHRMPPGGDPAGLDAGGEPRRAAAAADGGVIAGLLDWAARSSSRLAALADDGGRIEDLRGRCDAGRRRVERLAATLAEHRARAAEVLGAAVSAELAALAMPRATLSVRLDAVPAAPGDPLAITDATGSVVRAGLHGTQNVELLLTPHPGAPARPLGEGASGGELSRVMLAVEVVAADAAPTPTFVFDEVDAGIGGATALEVGRRLARLARRRQVLVVTHLAQVAAYADRHLVVTKDVSGAVTRSGVQEVGGAERLAELARMLGGHAESGAAREHAAELVGAADADRAVELATAAPREVGAGRVGPRRADADRPAPRRAARRGAGGAAVKAPSPNGSGTRRPR